VLAAVTPAPSAIVDVFNVTGCQHPVREIVETIAEVADRRLPAFRLPVTPARLAVRIAGRLPGPHGWAASLEQWLRDDCYSGERFAAAFGYSPHVGLTEGMRLTVASRRGKYTMTG
jgi:nucleoside-diphosphate-sugar epimerase